MPDGVKRLMKNNPLFAVGIVIFAVWILVAVFSPFLELRDPLEQHFEARFMAPNQTYWFGSDGFGRDIFSRIVAGSRISVLTGVIIVVVSLAFGSVYGGVAGYAGGVTDEIMMRLSELVLSFPPLILAMIIAAALGPGLLNSVIAMSIIWWPTYARMMRSLVITLKNNEYVEAQRVMGASHPRILFRAIFPNCFGSMLVLSTLDLGNAILVFSGLSFLGLGSPPPTAEWGLMVADGAANFYNWWMALFPGLAIFSVAIGANFIGDGLRDLLDPKLRRMV
ncbi:MAG: ABC transporter permease [Peptococcaceae bacterium]|jgi:peptide/nickel transport system permease protein|nr:ABC transporter permease [Peptococcaceae bacterium]